MIITFMDGEYSTELSKRFRTLLISVTDPERFSGSRSGSEIDPPDPDPDFVAWLSINNEVGPSPRCHCTNNFD